MRFKYYLRGCGLGILFASIVLMVTFHTKGSQMDDAAVMERASELGMVMPESEQVPEEDTQNAAPATQNDSEQSGKQDAVLAEPDSEDQAAETDNKKSGQKKSDQKTSEQKPSDKNEPDQKTSDQKTSDKNEPEPDASDTKEAEDITVTIKSGEVCRQLAEQLQELGLVEDAESFRKYMQQLGYDDQIRVGSYKLKRGMTQKEIAETFVKQ